MIQRELQNPLAERILRGDMRDGDTVRVTATPLGLVIEPVRPGSPETRQAAAA